MWVIKIQIHLISVDLSCIWLTMIEFVLQFHFTAIQISCFYYGIAFVGLGSLYFKFNTKAIGCNK